MASIYQLKSRFQALLRPVVVYLANRGVTANQVTLSSAGLSIIWGGAMVMFSVDPWPWLFLPFIMFVRMALNAIDGMLAREHGMKSALGAMLNELTDVVSDIALYLPFVFVAGHFSWLVVLVCLFAVVSEMAGVVAVQIGSSRRYDGPMGKSDRAFVFGTIGLLVGLGFSSASWIGIVLACVLALLFVTTLNRVSKALKERAAHE